MSTTNHAIPMPNGGTAYVQIQRADRGCRTIVILALTVAACSGTGGVIKMTSTPKRGTGVTAGHASSPRSTFATVSHAPLGDTFFVVIEKGAGADGRHGERDYQYSSDGDVHPPQAILIQDAINSERRCSGAVSVPEPSVSSSPVSC